MLRTWRNISIYLPAITLALTFPLLLEMPRKMHYGEALYMAVQHSLYLCIAWVGAFAEVSAVVFLIMLSFLVRKRKPTLFLALMASVRVAAGLAV